MTERMSSLPAIQRKSYESYPMTPWAVLAPLCIGASLIGSCQGAVRDPGVAIDSDRDSFTTEIDCDDGDAAIHPGATEICGDGIDQDCDGADGTCPACGDASITGSACLCGGTRHTDGVCCSDAWHDGGYCCDGTWQVGACTICVDGDSDGYDDAACGGDDCNDLRDTVHPGATEICGDGIDQDCSGDDLACPPDTTAPTLSGGQPSGTLPGGTTQTTLRVTTDEAATCRWSTTPGTSYGAMGATFTTTGDTSHETVVTGLADDQSYTYYLRCQDGAGNANASDYPVPFSVGSGPGPLTVSLVPSRTSGVAPLSVFFDATGTTDASVTARPFHDLEYRWSFGDPAGGATWAHGTQPGVTSKNTASGAVAAHVFETPGTYTIALTVFDGTNADSAETTVTVDDPDVVFAGINTVCIAATSLPVAGANGCPAGAGVYQQASFPTAVNAYAYPGTRMLFQRGDTFTAATSAVLDRTGPGILGAFGAGSAPMVQMTGNTSTLILSSRDTPDIKDWRIMDLKLDGMSGSESVGIDAVGGINQVLILNVTVLHAATGIAFSDSNLSWWYTYDHITHPMWDEIAIVDSTITPRFNAPNGWEIFGSANRGSIQGNVMGNMLNNSSMGSHVVRIAYMEKGLIANNTIARAGANQLAIKLHSQAWCQWDSPADTCTSYDNEIPPASYNYLNNTHPIGVFASLSGYTEKVIISDNKIIGADNPYTMSVASENLQSDERLRDIIIERNWFVSGVGTQLGILTGASDITIRNNIADMSQEKYKMFVSVFDPGTTPPSNNVGIFNNTMNAVFTVSGGEFHAVEIHPTATNVSVVNNLISASAALNPVLVLGTGASGLVELNNTMSDSPASLFVSGTPVNPADFSLNGSSPARGAGLSTVPVLSDFFLTVRPQGSMDTGAIEMH